MAIVFPKYLKDLYDRCNVRFGAVSFRAGIGGSDPTNANGSPALAADSNGLPVWYPGDGSARPITTAGGAGGATIRARVATAAVLPNTPTYANGTSGVGATLTAGSSVSINTAGIDGLTNLAVGDTVLVKDQATGAQNGYYDVTTVGSGSAAWVLTRNTLFDTAAKIKDGILFSIGEGTANADVVWSHTTNGTVVVGTTSLTFARESGVALLATSQTFTGDKSFSGAVNMNAGALLQVKGAGTGTGDVVARYGGTITEGLEIRVYEATVTPAAVETNLLNAPANSVIYSVQANCQTALTGGGTTVTWSIGTAATPNKYGTAGNGAGDTLAANGKLDFTATPTRLASAEQIVLTGCATGGAADGDTALTVGTVRVRIVYATCNSLDDV